MQLTWFLAQSQRFKSHKAKSLLFFHHVVQTANMRQDLHHKLIASMESQLGLARPADTGGCPGDTGHISMNALSMRDGFASHGSSGRKSCALRAPADQLWHVKDEITLPSSVPNQAGICYSTAVLTQVHSPEQLCHSTGLSF